ncbi:hypothetical protein QBC37DRAFT_393569 [Rhypophila decipiens]|uniref:Uncharacterized protein n=1 Tax=Rhypophila decipiens TaxID=261697 RepID=A0AAN6XYZ7_9PEZI|nr:hypothetical protein QBC37DRAFT_393569 [Rhypophila decipiens]
MRLTSVLSIAMVCGSIVHAASIKTTAEFSVDLPGQPSRVFSFNLTGIDTLGKTASQGNYVLLSSADIVEHLAKQMPDFHKAMGDRIPVYPTPGDCDVECCTKNCQIFTDPLLLSACCKNCLAIYDPYCYDGIQITPALSGTGPDKRCGPHESK